MIKDSKLLWTILIVSVLLNILFVGLKVQDVVQKKSKKVLSVNSREGLTQDIYNYCPNDANEIIFLGNSITSGFKLDELFPDLNVKNRGIWGDQTIDMLNRIEEVIESKPKKIFILAGINDIVRNVPLEKTIQNIESMILKIQKNSSETKIYIQSILPLTHYASEYFFDDEDMAYTKISEANKELVRLCNLRNVNYVSIDEPFLKNRELNQIYAWDGIHINGKGYLLWYKQIKNLVAN